jgi:type 1 fimbria pilin
MKKHIYRLIFAALTLFMVINVNAACQKVITNNGSIITGTSSTIIYDVTAQRDAPIGTILLTSRDGEITAPLYSCDSSGGYLYYAMGAGFNTPSSIANVYNTSIPGVGISIISSNGYVFSNPPSVQSLSPNAIVNAPGITVKLVKTGKITSGIWVGRDLAMLTLGNGSQTFTYSTIYNFKWTPKVVEVACSITTPNITVPLDDVLSSDLTSPGTTARPKTFNVGLNCNAGTRVNAKLTGTQNSSTSVNSVLQLTGAGSAGVASGVGIQLLYNNVPLELNNNITLKTSTGDLETFPFTAQYYQTAARVTGGTANTTATLEMTYQ